MVIISIKVSRNRFLWFQQLMACFPPVPTWFQNQEPEPGTKWNQPGTSPKPPLTCKEPRNRFLAS